jgi:hypothetical protein
MSAVVRDLIRMTLVRSLYVAGAFAATLLASVFAGQAPERSLWEWVALSSILLLLAIVGGWLVAFFELRER